MGTLENLTAALRRIPCKVSIGYAVLASLWILFSDALLYLLVKDPELLVRIAALKGWLFVGVTSFLLFLLVSRNISAMERAYRHQFEIQARYLHMFHAAPFSIWEIDLSAAKDELEFLIRRGVHDLQQYLANNADVVQRLLSAITVQNVNNKTLAMFGAEHTEQLVDALGTIVLPEGLPAFRDFLVAVAEGRERFEGETTLATLRGEVLTVMVSVALHPERDYADRIPVNVIDITERKKIEERLQLFELAVCQIREAVTITTAELEMPGPKIIYVNPAFTAITGYTAEEVIGKTPRVLQGPKTDREVMEKLRLALWQRQSFMGQAVNYRKNGSEFIMEWYVAPLVNRQFQVTHFVAVQRDVTEQRQVETDLMRTVEDLRRRLEELQRQ